MKYFLIYTALAISAATALIYEVVASNILFYYFSQNTYSVATVLSTFMVGLAAGSLIYYKIQTRIPDRVLFFGLLQLFIAAYGFLVFAHTTEIFPHISTLGIFTVSVLLLFVPTTALGIIFPLTLSLIDNPQKSSFVYAIDLVGAAGGSLVAGFYLIPTLGNSATVYIAVSLSLVSALIILPSALRILAVCSLCVSGFFIYQTLHIQHKEFSNKEYQYFKKSSPYGEIVVDNRVLYIDGRDQCAWDYPEEATEREIVAKTFMSISKPDAKALNIGLGCGLTLNRILTKTTEPVDVVEINPVVVEANRLQSTVLDNPRVKLTVMDGIEYLRSTTKRYDTVIIDIDNPAVVYSSNLYTVETFTNIKKTLVDGGVFGLWINRCDNGEYDDIMYNTLRRAFSHVYQINENIFIASETPLPYAEYVPFSEAKGVNTVDSKPLAKVYYDSCRFGKDSKYYMEF